MITGEYNAYGYRIIQDGKEIYSAGNSPWDSADTVPVDMGLGIELLHEYCQQTICELSVELDDIIGGIDLVTDS